MRGLDAGYAPFASAWIAGGGAGNAQIALVAFHTMFNIIGVLLAIPFAGLFVRLMIWLVPEKGPPLQRLCHINSTIFALSGYYE